jgi:hypothetical protein
MTMYGSAAKTIDDQSEIADDKRLHVPGGGMAQAKHTAAARASRACTREGDGAGNGRTCMRIHGKIRRAGQPREASDFFTRRNPSSISRAIKNAT